MLRLMPRPRIEDGLTAHERYEAKGKRPGEQIALRLSPKMAKAIDRARGKTKRATWIKRLIAQALGLPVGED